MKAPSAKAARPGEHKPAKAAKPKPKPPEQRKAARQPAYLQAKLAMSRPADASEQEADRVADQVARSVKAPGENSELRRKAADETVPAARGIARAAKPPEEQAARAEDEQASRLHRQAADEAGDEALQRDATDDAGADAGAAPHDRLDEATERRIESLRGTGDPLTEPVRNDMETRLGADLSDVRVHTGGDAAALCRRLEARAFTVGNDVFFAPGEFAPETEGGRRLLAHELTHVVQQSGGIGRMVQRDDGDGGGGGAEGPSEPTYHRGEGWVEFPSLPYPRVAKVPDGHFDDFAPLIRHRNYSGNRNTRQNENWFAGIDLEGTKSKLQEAPGYSAPAAGGQLTFKVPSPFRGLGSDPDEAETNVQYLRGSLEEIARETARPSWTPSGEHAPLEGRSVSYEIDHVVEAQVGATSPRGSEYQGRSDVDSMANYVLLRGAKNQAKGTAVRQSIEAELAAFIQGNEDTYRNKPFSEWDASDLKHRLSLQFHRADLRDGHRGVSIGEDDVWTEDEIERGAQIQALIDASPPQIRCVSLSALEEQVPEGSVWIFHTRQGGLRVSLDKAEPRRDFLKPFRLHEDSVFHELDSAGDDTDLATLYFSIPEGNDAKLKPMEKSEAVQVKSLNGSLKLGYFETGRVAALAGLRGEAGRREETQSSADGAPQLNGMSPIRVEYVGLTEQGLTVTGRIQPTISALEEAYVDFQLLGDELTVSRTFTVDDIKVPAPFSIDSCSVTVSGGTGGFEASGELDFAVEGLGEGSAEARYHSRDGFALGGSFNFDERLFGRGTNARIDFDYAAGEWSIGGQVTIPRGKVPGISSATIDARYSESEGFAASGDAELDIPGVERGTLSITHTEEEGLAIGGSFELSADTPGIRSGSLSAEVRERADGDGYALTASGEAVPDLPGIDSRLEVEYDDGAITAEVEARYQRGMLDGTLRAGATNRTLDEDGNPTGEPGDDIIVFGGGEVTIQIAPWLEGTAGIEFAPDGEVTVRGEIGLPDEIEIFPRKEIDKRIFGISVQAPIVPGIVAEIGGGLSAEAGIGPGVIDELRLGIEYNPAHEENTHVTGDAHLEVPADAGLRLSARAGIGLGITGASATGGLEVGGTLGIEGAAEAGVHIDWMPSQGLELNADVSVHAQPSFTFDISGYVSVTVLGGEIYGERWELASFTYGSDYRFGIRLPVTYKEGEPFDVSLDDVEFEVPDIDTNRLLDGLVEEIA